MITTGMLVSAAGLLLLSGVTPGGNYVNSVLAGALLSALGMGFTLVPATIVAMQGVERAQSGVASGLLNTSRLVGGALGLAVLSTIAAGQAGEGATSALAMTNGFGLAFHVGMVLALAGAGHRRVPAARAGRSRGRSIFPTPRSVSMRRWLLDVTQTTGARARGARPRAAAVRASPQEQGCDDAQADMLPTRHLLAFLLTIYVLILIPGPSVLFVVSRGVALGRRAALATVLGNAGGLVFQGTLVTVGIGSIVARSDAVFTALKLIGAAYLVFLGIKNIRERKALAELFGPAAQAAPKPLRRIIREGFLVGATNPKGVLIFTAILPQFIDRSQGHVTLQLATLGAICAVIALLSDGAWALASGTARHWLGRSSRRLETLTGVGGAILIALGFGLAVTTRRS